VYGHLTLYKADIDKLESVQRAFTKRIPGLKCATYGDWLKKLNVDRLELRRLRLDLLLTYKILFNTVDVDRDNLFTVRNGLVTRGHSLKLFMPRGLQQLSDINFIAFASLLSGTTYQLLALNFSHL
jgi:hypothetical protein